MKICALLIIIVLVINVEADCGCLKCSKCLQGVSIPGPAGFPVKVIMKKPECSCSCVSSCDICRNPSILGQQGLKNPHCCSITGKSYSAGIQIPHPTFPKRFTPLKNLKFKTDTVLVPAPNPNAPPSCINPNTLTTGDILNWLRNIQLSHHASVQTQSSLGACPASPMVQNRKCTEYQHALCQCPQCQSRQGNFPIDKEEQISETSQCSNDTYNIPETNRTSKENDNLKNQISKVSSSKSSESSSRLKRDLGRQGYDFFMKLLPQNIREPLHHSIKGVNYLKKSNPSLTLKEKINDLKFQKSPDLKEFYYKNRQPLVNFFPSQNLNTLKSTHKTPYGTLKSNYFTEPSKTLTHKNEVAKKSLTDSPLRYENHKKPRTFPLRKDDSLESFYDRPHRVVKSKSFSPEDRYTNILSEKQFKRLVSSYNPPSESLRLSSRHENKKEGDEKTLLRKLKRLNNNPYTSNLEDQATIFVEQLLKPEESKHTKKKFRTRSARSIPETELSRKKRTIILGSDEVDLPPHYEVEMVSVEDESKERFPEDFEYVDTSEDYEEDLSMSREKRYRKRPSTARRFYPSLPRLAAKHEVVIGKNDIQKAVREELNSYHKKVKQEQKIKELKDSLQKKKRQPFGIPQNPIFSLLTAPIKFIKHFHDINRGVAPVLTSLPKLVYSTKKVFKDLGKDFHRNCMDLASNVIGDFDHVHPSVIQEVIDRHGDRYRRDVEKFENATSNSDALSCPKNVTESVKAPTNTNATKSNYTNFIAEETKHFSSSDGVINLDASLSEEEKASSESDETLYAKLDTNNKPGSGNVAINNAKETQNFHLVPDKHVRKKRYVIKVVDDDEIHDHVHEVLSEKYGYSGYPSAFEKYYETVDNFLSKLYSHHKPICQIGEDCYYERSTPEHKEDESRAEYDSDSEQESSEEQKAKKKRVVIRKVKPKIIIDKKGIPFMDYNGYKRPIITRGKKLGILRNIKSASDRPKKDDSSEETGTKIATLIARAKETTDVVGSTHKDMVPTQILKQRISSLLEEVDQLVHLNAENYDDIFDELIKIQQVKSSIEQDWKRLLISNRVGDINAKISLLSKFKDLQQSRDKCVKKIVSALKKNDNEFVRCQLVNSLVKLQKLQSLITSVVDDFERHLHMKTAFSAKSEIKYVDYLSSLNFVNEKTREDLVKKLSEDRDTEGQKHMDLLHKLKKILSSADQNQDKIDQAAKLLWEMKNLEKLQIETINEMEKKLSKSFKIKKELKILFDLQKRFEDCSKELNEHLEDISVKEISRKGVNKKDFSDIIADAKKRREERMQKLRERSNFSKNKG